MWCGRSSSPWLGRDHQSELPCSAQAPPGLQPAEGSLGGGSRIGGVVVSPENPGEAGDELEIEAGIGLVDVAIEVHVAERGMLSRLVAAVESGMVAGGLGIDERTALIVGDSGLRVEGKGSVWRVLPTDGGVLVSTIGT